MEIFLDFLFNSSQNWTREKIDRTILRWSLKSVSQPNDSAMGWAINKKLFQQKENLSEKSSSELFEPKFLNQKLLTPKFPLFREKLSSLFYEDGRGLCRVGDTIFRPFLNSKSKSLWVKTHMAIACWRGWHWRLADLFDRAWESAGLLASRVWVFWVSIERGRRERAWGRREGWGREHGERREGDARRDAMGLLAFLCFLPDFWGIMGFCFLSGN